MNAIELRQSLRKLKYDDAMIEMLLEGILREDLEAVLAKTEPDVPVDLQRMNLLGGLRSWGFIIEGKKKGETIRIVDWIEKVAPPDVSVWEGPSKSTLEWIESLPLIDEAYEERFRYVISALQPKEPVLHESSWLDLRSYELGPNARMGYIYAAEGIEVIISRKFYSRPRFSLYVVGLEEGFEQSLIDLAHKVGQASVKQVQIKHLHPDLIPKLRALSSGWLGSIWECSYDMADIVEHPDKYWNKRGLATIRSREKDCTWAEDPPLEDQITVIDEWKKVNARRQRQVATGRDYVAARSPSRHKITFGGYREGLPVAHVIYDTFGHRNDVVALINEKCLNYSTMPGGKYGISDWLLFRSAQDLVSRGYRIQQAGGMLETGDRYLKEKKQKFMVGEPLTVSWFTVNGPISEYA